MAINPRWFLPLIDDFLDDTEHAVNLMHLNNMLMALGARILISRDNIPKITGYAEIIVPQYTLDDFKSHYRISRGVFQHIVQVVSPYLITDHLGGAEQVMPEKKMLLFCWFMANMDSMRELGNIFGVAVSTVHHIIIQVLDVFEGHLKQMVIQWPDAARQRALANETLLTHGLPGIIGYIDGTHIRLPFCINGDQDYINRKKYPSIVLQIVVDQHMQITNCYTGWPGCTHDARVLRNSNLYTEAEAGHMFLPQHYIIGDSAYPLKPWLVTVFKDNGRLSPEQQRYNRRVSSLRQTVERCIGHVKGRFRKLREVYIFTMETVCKTIVAGCILHNFCVIAEDDIEEFIDMNQVDQPNNYPAVYANNVNAVAFRNQLVQQL